jgi:hypothetical protein
VGLQFPVFVPALPVPRANRKINTRVIWSLEKEYWIGRWTSWKPCLPAALVGQGFNKELLREVGKGKKFMWSHFICVGWERQTMETMGPLQKGPPLIFLPFLPSLCSSLLNSSHNRWGVEHNILSVRKVTIIMQHWRLSLLENIHYAFVCFWGNSRGWVRPETRWKALCAEALKNGERRGKSTYKKKKIRIRHFPQALSNGGEIAGSAAKETELSWWRKRAHLGNVF